MNIIDYDVAFQIASNFLSPLQIEIEGGVSIVDCKTVEMDRGWVFFYEANRYLETCDELARLAGNGPVFVNRTGDASFLASSIPWQQSTDVF